MTSYHNLNVAGLTAVSLAFAYNTQLPSAEALHAVLAALDLEPGAPVRRSPSRPEAGP